MRNLKKLQAHPDLQLLSGEPLNLPVHCLDLSDGGAELYAVAGLATESGDCQAATGYGKPVLKRAGRA